MTSAQPDRPNPDEIVRRIAEYAAGGIPRQSDAYDTARLCLLDSLGCAFLSLDFSDCRKLLGPVVPGATLNCGARVPGTDFELDPVQAAFNFGTMIRWLDYNDTWLAAEWGHPSDNLGAILMTADWHSRQQVSNGLPPLTVHDVLTAMIQAYEIQGVLALENAFNRVGLDHVLLVRIASTALATKLLDGSTDQIADAVSHAWLDGGALRTYRHAPNTGSRKSWAAGDATSRAVRLALWTMAGEPGYVTPLTAAWGFESNLFDGQSITLGRPLGTYVMENVLFKVSFPAEFHGQTAVEAALQLHPLVKDRLDRVERIHIETQEPAVRIIAKHGPLQNPADRDHCLQYIVAVGLIHGTLTADHYEDETAADPRIDHLRKLTEVTEDPAYSRDYLDPGKRSIANAVQVWFDDGASTGRVAVEYPLGHRRRRDEARPQLMEKFRQNAGTCLSDVAVQTLAEFIDDPHRLDRLSVPEFVDLTLKTHS